MALASSVGQTSVKAAGLNMVTQVRPIKNASLLHGSHHFCKIYLNSTHLLPGCLPSYHLCHECVCLAAHIKRRVGADQCPAEST